MMELCLKARVRGFDVEAVDQDGLTALQVLELREDAYELIDVFAQICGYSTTEAEEYYDALEYLC